jgi:predicted porin
MTKKIHYPMALVALSLLAAGAVQAQSGVTVYGILDASVRYSSGLDAAYNGTNTSDFAVNSGINNTSRFGLRGTEDLGDGLKAVFNLESGINVDTGAQANATKLFDRAATVGLQGDWGTVTLGRQTTVLADTLSTIDPLGVRFPSFNPNVAIAALNAHRLGIEYGPAGSTAGAYRLDNSVKYAGRFGDFTLRAMHAFGEQAGNSSALSSSGVGGAYQTADWGAALAYAQFKNAAGLTLKGYLGGLNAMLGSTKFNLSYGSHEADTTLTAKTRNRTFGLGATVPLTGEIDLVLTAYNVKRTRTAAVDDGFNRVVSFLEYKLSKRSKLYAELDHTKWKNAYQGAGLKDTATGLSFGILHTF